MANRRRSRFADGQALSDHAAGVLEVIDAIRQAGLADGTWPKARDLERRWWPADGAETDLTWDGCARMASARLNAGLELDGRDIEALHRAMPAES